MTAPPRASPAPLGAALQSQWWIAPATPMARALSPLAALYAMLARLHRAASRPQQVGVPVVVVGNLIAGGAGKTPTTIAVVRLLRAFGWQPGIVSRGHGRRGRGLIEVRRDIRAADCGDEPLLIHLRTGMPVMVGRDRVAAARALCTAHPDIDVIVADDGLQHHRLARDLQIIVFDGRGVGNGLLLPAGPLREPLPAQPPPATLVLYSDGRVSTPWPGWLATRRLAGVLPLVDWWQGRRPPADSWRALLGRPLLAVAGTATPERFFAMLRDEGLSLVMTQPLPDHDPFDTLPWPPGTSDVVITEKDAVKLPMDRAMRELGATRVWVVPLDLEPEEAFAAALERHLPHPPHPDTPASP
jgi:tetraacyldisaccharide 4'-kinase